MSEVQAQEPQATRAVEPSPRDSGGFWRSLPGILTAAGTFLAGLAGLAAVIVPNFFGSGQREPTERAAPALARPPAQAVSSNAPDTTRPVGESRQESAAQPAALPPDPPDRDSHQPAEDRYVAAFASDGFVVLRGQPTIASAEIRRILVGVSVRCGGAKWTANGYRWRRCVDEDGNVGYMSDTFLRKA